MASSTSVGSSQTAIAAPVVRFTDLDAGGHGNRARSATTTSAHSRRLDGVSSCQRRNLASVDLQISGPARVALEMGLELAAEAHHIDRRAVDEAVDRDAGAGEQEQLDRARAIVDVDDESEHTVVEHVADLDAMELEQPALGRLTDRAGPVLVRLDLLALAARG